MKNKNLLKIYFGGLLIVPIVLLVLPANFFDTGQSICLSVLLLHKTCPGCGITRSIQHLVHFDFDCAWRYNKLAFIVLPVLIFLWIKELIRLFKIMR